MIRKSGKKCQEAYVDKQGAPIKTETQKGSIQKAEAGAGSLGGTQRHCLNMQTQG